MSEYKKFSRVDIDAIDDYREEWQPVDAWGALVLLRNITLKELDRVQAKATRFRGTPKENLDRDLMGLYLISECLLEPDTKEPMYSFDEIKKLKEKSAGAIVQLANAVRDINGLGEDEKKGFDAELLLTENGVTDSS